MPMLVVSTSTMIVMIPLLMMLTVRTQIIVVIDSKRRMVTMIIITLPPSTPSENLSPPRRHASPSAVQPGQRTHESGFRRGSRGRVGRGVERFRYDGAPPRHGIPEYREGLLGLLDAGRLVQWLEGGRTPPSLQGWNLLVQGVRPDQPLL